MILFFAAVLGLLLVLCLPSFFISRESRISFFKLSWLKALIFIALALLGFLGGIDTLLIMDNPSFLGLPGTFWAPVYIYLGAPGAFYPLISIPLCFVYWYLITCTLVWLLKYLFFRRS